MPFLVMLRFNEFINQTIMTDIAAEEKISKLCIAAFIQSPRQQLYIVAVSTYYSSA